MDISLRLDTLGMVEIRYLRGRERYRDWPQFELLAASRQARILAYLNHDVAEQLHQQILTVEAAIGLDVQDEDEDEDGLSSELEGETLEHAEHGEGIKASEKESSAFSPAFAQALKQLNDLARQRLPDASASGGQPAGELSSLETSSDEEDALEQLQDAFVQMMEVVRELAEELSTDALKVTGRFKCARTDIKFIPRADEADDDEEDQELAIETEDGVVDVEVELVMILQLFEEGHARADDLPAVELQLDVDDFERLHETLDFALERERRSRRRR
ncbi:MAG: hypothetical protein E6J34_21100 [Chloroflexi bacterium]|nr:MAG: hypothetical protein E6J34_21100 [Chloroflexota bacterium]